MRSVVSPITMALVRSRRVAVAGRSGSRDNVPVDPNSGGGGWGIVLDRGEMGPEHVPLSCGLAQGYTGVLATYTHIYILAMVS